MDAVLPEAYARWRGTRIGELTERLERDLVLDLAGELDGLRLLDVGCGDGAYTLAAAERGARTTAVDISEAMLEAARCRTREAGLHAHFERADASRLPFEDGSFDLVLAVTSLCFVEDAAASVREAARVLVAGGKLILADLNRWSIWAAWRSARGWLGSNTWRQARFRSAREFKRLAEDVGLEVKRISGAIFYPPIGLAAHILAPIDPLIGQTTTMGAAFVAMTATRPSPHNSIRGPASRPRSEEYS